jgi:hypothetical protein
MTNYSSRESPWVSVVHVLDRVTDGPKPQLVADLGATYHHGTIDDVARAARPVIIIGATGVGRLVFQAISATGAYGIICLTGASPTGRKLSLDTGELDREVVLENDAIVGSVNANIRHYLAASQACPLRNRSHTWSIASGVNLS